MSLNTLKRKVLSQKNSNNKNNNKNNYGVLKLWQNKRICGNNENSNGDKYTSSLNGFTINGGNRRGQYIGKSYHISKPYGPHCAVNPLEQTIIHPSTISHSGTFHQKTKCLRTISPPPKRRINECIPFNECETLIDKKRYPTILDDSTLNYIVTCCK